LYDDSSRPRIDAVVCVNILTLFYQHKRGHELKRTYDWVHKVLLHRAYVDGTLYYSTPDYFLFALSRLISYAMQADTALPPDLMPLFRERCRERMGAPGDALALAMRVVALRRAGVAAAELQRDVDTLKLMQCEDGGWPFCPMYRVPSAKVEIGNRGVSTAMAISAIRATAYSSLEQTYPGTLMAATA
jgi:hypothetical protein